MIIVYGKVLKITWEVFEIHLAHIYGWMIIFLALAYLKEKQTVLIV